MTVTATRTDSPRVTVVMPAYNAEATIANAIDSVVAQTLGDWELVVVDDGSSDRTAERAGECADGRVRVLASTHRGVSAARNVGLSAARAAVVTFLDADDSAAPDWLASLVEPFDDPDVGVVCCALWRVADGEPDGTVRPGVLGGLFGGVTGLFLPGSMAARTTLVTSVGGFDEAMASDENTDLGIRLVEEVTRREWRIEIVDRPLVTWNRGQDRFGRYDRSRLLATERTLVKYAGRLDADRATRSDLHRIAAVAAFRSGFGARSRSHARASWRARPGDLGAWVTLSGSHVAPLGRRRWARRSFSSAAAAWRSSSSPAVSVLMPVYNAADTVREAIDSVLGQTFTDFEVVVVDDGSTDGTADALRPLALDPRVRVVTHEHNLGLVAALATGLAQCRGGLVARLDADDSALPTRLERQVAVFTNNHRLVLCAAAYERVDTSGRLLRVGTPPSDHASLATMMLTGNRIQHSSVMFRRDAVERVGGYDPTWFPVEDYDLWLRLLDVGEYVGLSSVEARYAESPQSVSGSLADRQAELLGRGTRAYRDRLLALDGSSDRPVEIADVLAVGSVLRVGLGQRGIPTDRLREAIYSAASAVGAQRPATLRWAEVAARSPGVMVAGLQRRVRTNSA